MDHIGLASFLTMQTQVGQYVQDTSADRLTRIKDRINWNYFDAYQKHDWRDLRRFHEGKHTHFVDADNLSTYPASALEGFQTNGYEAMPFDVGEIYTLLNGDPAGTMQTPPVLTKMDQAEFFEAISFDPDQTGVPEIWTLAGTTPLRRPIVTDERLLFQSTSASDTTTIRITGTTNAASGSNQYGVETPETVTLTGTTAVASGNRYAKGWSVLSLNILGVLTGNITVSGQTSGITYMVFLGASGVTDGPSYSQRQLVRMWPCPTAGTKYSLYYKRKCAKLIHDQDTPMWPIAAYLVEKSIADIQEQMRLPELAANHHGKADSLLAHMIQNEESSVNHMSRPQSIQGYMRGYDPVRPGP